MLLNLRTIILPFLMSCTNRRCANLPRLSVRVYGSIKRMKRKQKIIFTIVDLLSIKLVIFRLIITYFGTLRMRQIAPF